VSYSIHTTKGLIISQRALREADRVYSILTQDFGLIRATATGVRKGHSKLRGLIEPISLASVSLVRGKEYWRITSAELILKIGSTEELLKPLSVLEKLVQGEAPNKELFEAVVKIIQEGIKDEMFEIKLVSVILFHLGYLKEEDLNLNKIELIKAINHGLEASHLTNR
jgi:DNA repair protein RecO (recombination protein O)